jgi:thiol-disulfide isomerase/thioredoxin
MAAPSKLAVQPEGAMSKSARLREQTARERIAAQQATAIRKERRRRAALAVGSILAVIVVVTGIIVARAVRSDRSVQSPSGGVRGAVLPATAAKDIMSVPAGTLARIGGGSVPDNQDKTYSGQPVAGVTGTPLSSGGKPEMLYIGAEYCPYCAAMRWSMAVALSRFGAFSTPLRAIRSSPTDVDPSTPTLTFYQARYISKYLTFTPVENEDLDHNPLQNTTASQLALWRKFDSTSSGLGYPFIDFGNQAIITAPLYDPGILKGMTWAQIAATLHDPASLVAQAVDGTANYMTAAICHMTASTPAPVCNAPSIRSLAATIR